MFFSCKELKRQARETLNERYGLPMGAFILHQLITKVITFLFELSYQNGRSILSAAIYILAQLMIYLLSAVLYGGQIKIHLKLARGESSKLTDLFWFFKNQPDRLILAKLYLMFKIFVLAVIPASAAAAAAVFLGAKADYAGYIFLAVACIPSIYLMSIYFLVQYFLVDNEDMGIKEAFKASREHMKGSMGRFFYMVFSFFGIFFLCVLSFGIGYLWVVPYMNQTQTAFYRNITKEVS